ncbi:MAG: Regulatory protein LuxO [Flavobacteriia bacterium]|nr:MAG: Regulatory protein LuxO [Flavobacteriia bacterium]
MHQVEVFSSGKEFLENINRRPDLITLDYRLPDMNGIEILRRVQKEIPGTPVIVISGQEDVDTAVGLLKEGIYDYIVKNENTKDRIWNALQHVKEKMELTDEIERLREEVNTKYDFSNIKGNSEEIKKVLKLVEKATKTNIIVSISGDTGTGKEQVAKAIHYNSNLRKRPFVAVNMAAIPTELIESELFGYEKGAFTGADTRKLGRFEEADGGTLFLDEIGELELSLQSKLLRVLQEKEVTRLGSNKPNKVNARIIVATNKNLKEEVNKGAFREDLYFRLLGFPIELPPLKARGNDVLILTKYFAEAFCKENNLKKVSISKSAQSRLKKYNWPGNVRELKALIELAVVLCDDHIIEAEHLNFQDAQSMQYIQSDKKTLKQYVREIILHHLELNDQNVMKVAEELDIGKSTVYRELKKV